jgi:hypothetical protein
MELWQMDVVGGFPLADGTCAKVLTGIDDHSRYCVSARVMARERTRAVCDGLRAAISAYGAPVQILTDNGKVFTGRFNHPPVEVLFDAICRENGIEHLLTQPRSPTTTGKIERLHRSMRAEFLAGAGPFASLKAAQSALDEWVADYNTRRPHQSLNMDTPAQRFTPGATVATVLLPTGAGPDRSGGDWVSRRVCANGVVSVSWQQVSVGRHYAGARAVVAVSEQNLGLLRRHFGLGPARGRVINYGRPEPFFTAPDPDTRARLRAELGLSESAVVALTVARLTKIKGHAHLLDALSVLRAAGRAADTHFVWLGEGEQRAALAAGIVRLGLYQHRHIQPGQPNRIRDAAFIAEVRQRHDNSHNFVGMLFK